MGFGHEGRGHAPLRPDHVDEVAVVDNALKDLAESKTVVSTECCGETDYGCSW